MGREEQNELQPHKPDNDNEPEGSKDQKPSQRPSKIVQLFKRLEKTYARIRALSSHRMANLKHRTRTIISRKKEQLKEFSSKRSPLEWTRSLSLTESLLGILIAIIALTQITIWLTSMGRLYIDQSRVEMINQLVNQTYRVLHDSNLVDLKTPLCIQRGIAQLTYVKCDDRTLVAVDEFGTEAQGIPGNNLLMVRRFYDKLGTNVLGIDRYEYSDTKQLIQKKRVIFRKMFGVFTCSYLVSTYEPTGISLKTEFDGTCGADFAEIPTQSFFMRSPPPITLFLPYR
jgi:hypothetical protein